MAICAPTPLPPSLIIGPRYPPSGFLVTPNAVPEHQVLAARAALDEGASFTYTADDRLGILAFNPAAWPVIMELSGGGPMIRLGSGIHNAAYSGTGNGGGGPLHCNREVSSS